MILDANGRPMRQAIGFLREMIVERPCGKDLISSCSVECVDDDPTQCEAATKATK